MVKRMDRATLAAEVNLHQIADACFAYLVQDTAELQRFMEFAGYDSAAISGAVGTDTLARGMIEYFAASESSLLAMCANAGLTPERFMQVFHTLNRQV